MRGMSRIVQSLVLLLLIAMIAFNLQMTYYTTVRKDKEETSGDPESPSQYYTTLDPDQSQGHKQERSCNCPKRGALNHINETNWKNFTFQNSFWKETSEGSDQSQVSVIGHQRTMQSFLSIGVPSIRRVNGYEYILATTQSLVNESSAADKQQIVVIIFLADFNDTYNKEVARAIQSKFHEYIETGFIQILRVSQQYYPPLVRLKQNFKDAVERVQWRAKQVADYSFLFHYAHNQSRYYLQLEDDVQCAPDYFGAIKQTVTSYQRKHNWAMLEFSELGFIGKLFRSSDLLQLSRFMLMFYDEQPVDWLMSYYRKIKAQQSPILRKPTLFQHIGRTSSFDTSRINDLQDRFFNTNATAKEMCDDPNASILSTMHHYQRHKAGLAYGSPTDYFWAQDPEVGDTLGLVFDTPQKIKRVSVHTGIQDNPHDILQDGRIDVGAKVADNNEHTGALRCDRPVTIGYVRNGTANVENVGHILKHRIQCLVITVTQKQINWIVFNQICVILDQ